MPHLNPIRLDDDTIIYIEAADAPQAPPSEAQSEPELQPKMLGDLFSQTTAESVAESGSDAAKIIDSNLDFGAIETLIKTSTQRTINAFKGAMLANVDKVKLEFGVNISGSAGVPYITQGEVGSSFKITVECSFPERKDATSGA